MESPPPPPALPSDPPPPPPEEVVPPPPEPFVPPPPPVTESPTIVPVKRKQGWNTAPKKDPLSIEEILARKKAANEAAAK
ncbi:hypothetical protein LTR28_013205, partial [Elasticomyces elasticus]